MIYVQYICITLSCVFLEFLLWTLVWRKLCSSSNLFSGGGVTPLTPPQKKIATHGVYAKNRYFCWKWENDHLMFKNYQRIINFKIGGKFKDYQILFSELKFAKKKMYNSKFIKVYYQLFERRVIKFDVNLQSTYFYCWKFVVSRELSFDNLFLSSYWFF